MTPAYDEMYLRNARTLLATSLDYAVNTLDYEPEDYYNMFIKSDLARRFENGDPFIVSGLSGIELVLLIQEKATGKSTYKKMGPSQGRSREYWAGWAIAYYQWYSACSLKKLQEIVPINVILNMYDKYHEMDISQFADRVDEMRMSERLSAYLKALRKERGYSQSELAKQTGIPLKTLQHYEQGTKSLANANAVYVVNLSRALRCEPESLIGC